MRDNVDILSYWIKELRRIKEFQEIAKVEKIEFARLYGETERSLRNLFIETADEDGIKRLEKITGIYPEAEDTLEKRRAQLYVYWNDKEPYTEENLKSRLETLCGAGNYEVNPDYSNFLIQIITQVGGYGIFDEITRMLDYFLPANLLLDLQNTIKGESSASIYHGMGMVNALEYTVTNDINATYPLEQNMYIARPMVMASETLVTNDISEEYISEMSLNQGMGTVFASEVTVTNDIDSENELNEDKSVGSVLTTSQVITIYE